MGLFSKNSNREELNKILIEKFGYKAEDIKSETLATLKRMILQEEKDAQELEKELEEQSTRVVRKKSKIKNDDEIYVMNGLDGGLFYRSDRTNRTWEFKSFGQETTMEFGELVDMRNKYPTYLKDGLLIILDKDVQEEFNLVELYKNIVTPENIDSIFSKNVDELSRFIDNLPSGMKSTVANRAMKLYESGKLDSKKVIDLIQNKFGFSLEDNAPLNSIL